MTNGLIFILLGLMVALQACFLPFGYLPVDFLLLFVVFIGLYRGKGAGLWVGFLAGLAMDVLVGPSHCLMFVLAKSVTGILADSFNRMAKREHVETQILAAASLTLTHELLVAASAYFLHLTQGGLWQVFGLYVIPKTVLHAFLAGPFFWILQRLIRRRVVQNKLAHAPRVIKTIPH